MKAKVGATEGLKEGLEVLSKLTDGEVFFCRDNAVPSVSVPGVTDVVMTGSTQLGLWARTSIISIL